MGKCGWEHMVVELQSVATFSLKSWGQEREAVVVSCGKHHNIHLWTTHTIIKLWNEFCDYYITNALQSQALAFTVWIFFLYQPQTSYFYVAASKTALNPQILDIS